MLILEFDNSWSPFGLLDPPHLSDQRFGVRASQFKMESLFQQVLIAHGVEAEKLGRAVGAFARGFFKGQEEVEAEDFFAEVPFIERGAEH